MVSNNPATTDRDFSISGMISHEDLEIHLAQIHQDIPDSTSSGAAGFVDGGACFVVLLMILISYLTYAFLIFPSLTLFLPDMAGSLSQTMERVRITAKAVSFSPDKLPFSSLIQLHVTHSPINHFFIFYI